MTSARLLRILQLEDDPLDVRLSRICLEDAGFELLTDVVMFPEEFAKALAAKPYDVILADYNLPGWTAMEALEQLRASRNETPLILVTGTIGEETAVECLKKGATDYVLKDRLIRLPHAVERALRETAEREARKLVEQSRDLLAMIVESSEDAIIGMAHDGTIVSWNRGAARIYGYSLDEVPGKPVQILFPVEGANRIREDLEALRNGISLARYETVGTTKQGAAVDIALTLSPIRSADGEIAGTSAIIRDITKQKKLQAEFFVAQKMEAIGRLAAGVAHDFNNLLTVVTGYSALLLGRINEKDPTFEALAEINRASERAASLTHQLLAFSKKQQTQRKVLDLNQIVADMDRMLRRVIGEDIELETRLDPRLCGVRADAGQIEQVLMNLAVNARDAMPGGGKLIIATANEELRDEDVPRHLVVPAGNYVSLAVTDTGAGIDLETQMRMFEPFFTTKGDAGTGLGLASVYGIVEQSSGTIQVTSEPGDGTTFKVYLPPVSEPVAQRKPNPSPRPSGGSETVLVVEDEDIVRTLVCSVLANEGYAVLSAKNAVDALLLCERNVDRIQMVLTDVIMPVMSGAELAVRLREMCPRMKLLFMSGYEGNALAHHGVIGNQIGFLEKPFSPEALTRKVRGVLDGN